MGKKSPPPPPDFTAAAEATGESSRVNTEQQTFANRPDQYTPWGATNWFSTPTFDPATGETYNRWASNETLTPELQGALDSEISLQRGRSDLGYGLMGDVAGDLGQPMDWDKFGDQRFGVEAGDPNLGTINPFGGPVTAGSYSPEGIFDKAEQSLYSRRTGRLDPQFADREEALEVKLLNQGLRPGDEAYDKAFANFERDRTDAYQVASDEASIQGGQEASRLFGMELSAGGSKLFGSARCV